MRRLFDHFHAELSVHVGRLVPRYALWLCLREAGVDPERLTRDEVLGFCRQCLPAFLAAQGLQIAPRPARRLERELRRYDPARPTPYDHAARV